MARAHGLRGQVVVWLSTNREERLAPGSELWAGPRRLTVADAVRHQHRWVVAFSGVDDRDAAEALQGAVLTATRLEDPGVLWVHELIGSVLVDQSGIERGRIVALEANPASDLIVLDTGGLVPLRFVTEHRPGTVVAELPAGLLD